MKWTPEMCREQLELKQSFGLERLTKVQLTEGIEALKTLIKQAEYGEVSVPNMGICRNWHLLWGHTLPEGYVAYSALFVLATYWDHPQRSRPMGVSTASPVKYYFAASGMWDGKQREARLHLMRYMLKRLRDWRRRAPK